MDDDWGYPHLWNRFGMGPDLAIVPVQKPGTVSVHPQSEPPRPWNLSKFRPFFLATVGLSKFDLSFQGE